MEVISIDGLHIIHRPERKRGFQVCINCRLTSFGSLEAAVRAKKAHHADTIAFVKSIEWKAENEK